MITKSLATLGVLFAALSSSTAYAQTTNLVTPARQVIEELEAISGRPIAVLTRVDNDPATFWIKAAQALCEATGDNWCDDEVQFLTDTTNQIGWARIFTYTNAKGEEKTACALLPPRPGLDSGYVATGLSGGRIYPFNQLPSRTETEAYLWLLHAANCMNSRGDEIEHKRADAFATLSLTVIQGDPQFVGAYAPTPTRNFNKFRNQQVTHWATNVGERLLLELWKEEAKVKLDQIPCSVSVVASSDIDTDQIVRDSALPQNANCQTSATDPDGTGGYHAGQVTDQNLWLWTAQVGLPPAPYSPFKMFANLRDGVGYAWQTADQLSKQ